MRKGLTLTLMTVAIALVSVQAMAMVPVISDIPSPIVGSLEPVTGGSKFVYIDALNITTCASDQETSSTNLMWTYTGSRDTHGASHYRINGIAPMDLTITTNDPTSPTTAQIINRTIGKINNVAEWNSDATPRTITVRNHTLSPLGAADTGFTGAAGIIAAETEAVTFFVSDGNAYTSKTIFIYSDNGGADRLSGVVPSGWTNLKTDALASSAELAKWHADPTNSGLTTHNFTTGQGICLDAPLTGANLGSYYTDWGYLTLTANTVYRIKLTMNGTQATKGNVPLWDFLIENYKGAPQMSPARGINAYNLDQYYYDAASGANAIVSSAGGTLVTLYFTPLAVNSAQWNNVMFNAPRSAEKDADLCFRMLDVDGVGSGQTKQGAVCITQCVLDSIPYNRVTEGASHANITSFVENNAGGTGNCRVTTLWGNNVGTNVSFTGGIIKLTPNAGASAGQSLELAEVSPAADLAIGNYSNMGTTTYLDDWPIPWQDQKILKLEVGLSAPTATDAAHPWDAVQLGFEPLSDELIGQSWVSSSYNSGSPPTGSVQSFVYLYSTGNMSASSQFRQLKWRVTFVNNTAASFPSNNPATDPVNTGAVQLHNVKVNTVTIN